ncbi:MAG: bifunctional 4-hydroxy-2-oxoglutarate aldolase/2-dehydro-3-deoxy-phosphogluconate aldolase [Spirochaetales bacterium]|nr:bifunctional 4-hydroxy-2-oxoglutarate aldolase/2-dehydro-3-deoxy-phosphogluconate aldolase [Spirochaetales bacterium]
MSSFLQKIENTGIIPVVKIEDAGKAVALGKALLEGGIPVAEITFRTKAAEQAISNLHKSLPELLLGAGTILTADQAKAAAAAGAEFIVSPGFNPKVVQYCLDNSIPVIPGINNPTQIEQALDFGLDLVKYFPAEASGGLTMLKAMSAPYGGLRFIPTGGIGPDNLNSYLAFDRVIACGGSWMVTADLINSDNFAKISELSRQAVQKMLGFELIHIGLNEESEKTARTTAELFASLFMFRKDENPGSIFMRSEALSSIEVLKKMYLGTHGHMAIATDSIERAVAYLQSKGIRMRDDTRNIANGRLKTVYLDLEISGFAVHLFQK